MFGKKKVIAVLMCFCLLALTACGSKGSDASGGNGGGSGFKDAVSSAVSSAGEALSSAVDDLAGGGKDTFRIYLAGSDVIAFYVHSDKCKDLVPVEEYTQTPAEISFNTHDYLFQGGLESFSAHIYYRQNENEDGQWANSGYASTSKATEDTYFNLIYEKGIVDKLKINGTVELTFRPDTSVGDNVEKLAEYDAADVVKRVSLEELADIAGKALKKGTPEGNWAGTYLTDSYAEKQGYAEIIVTENGGMYVKANFGGEEAEYIGVEELNEYSHEDPNYFYSDLVVLNTTDREPKKFQYALRKWDDGTSEEGIGYTEDKYDDSGSDNYWSASLNKYQERFVAPADYVDADPDGMISRKDPDDSKYFTPKSDDYIMWINRDYTWNNSITFDEYELRSYNINGMLIDYRYKWVFKDAASAKQYYDYKMENSWEDQEYHLSDNIVYFNMKKYDPTVLREVKGAGGSSEFYNDIHYYYYKYYGDDENYRSYVYMSKPFTEKERKMSLDDVIFWRSVPSGYHNCFETKDAYLGIELGGSYTSVSLYGTDNPFSSDIGYLRVDGKNVYGSAFFYQYDYDKGDYKYGLSFTEIICETGKATVTQYVYDIGDDAFSTDININNYKEKTPAKVITRTYDLSRATSYY